MNRLILTFLFTLLFLQAALANPFKGFVFDLETGEELTGVHISVKNQPGIGTVTGLDGSFSLKGFDAYPITVVCSYLGYITKEVMLTEQENGSFKIHIKPSAMLLGEMMVQAKDVGGEEYTVRDIEKTSVNVVNAIGSKAIQLSADLTVANVVQRMSGVTVERSSTGDGQYAILRGMDKRYNYTLVNGVKIPSPDNKNRFVPLDIFPAEMLERLEVTKALTADMEGDGVGGAINLVMKDAPSERKFTANFSTGYNALFLSRDFKTFDSKGIDKESPFELYGPQYSAKQRDFRGATIDFKEKTALPNIIAGASYGDRFFDERLGIMAALSYQNTNRGNNSTYYKSVNSTSDASNLPVLVQQDEREYSQSQSRLGAHAKLDYQIVPGHKLQWYNAYMDFTNKQVRDVTSTDLSIGYDPEKGDYNLAYNTRFRWNHQTIMTSTLKGEHAFVDNKLKLDWTGVYSKAYNETPDNATVYTLSTVRNSVQNPISVQTLGGATRRWEHNSDQDLAGYINLRYKFEVNDVKSELSTGGVVRDKKRSNFFNEYEFRPYDASKPEGMEKNLIKGVDWNTYSEIKFNVHNPMGATGNPLNYDATEQITAGYLQAKVDYHKLHMAAGLRMEHTNQGYNLLHATEGVKNEGKQIYYDLLPSVHLRYALNNVNNIRASYYKAINRPSFFEIVPYRVLNEEYTERGNPELKHTTVHNFDVRYEYFPRQSEQIMVGAFYKRLNNPIEYGMITEGQGTFFMPDNFGDASNFGIEVDFVKYFNKFGIKANYTLTLSDITTTKVKYIDNPDPNASDRLQLVQVDQSRPLNGQAAHVANLTVMYKDMDRQWDAQLAYSLTGKRLYAVSRYYNDDMWQAAYSQLDASVEKGFKNGLTVFAKATNLLNTPMELFIKKYNKVNENVEGYSSRKDRTTVRRDYYGQNIQLGLRYEF